MILPRRDLDTFIFIVSLTILLLFTGREEI